MQGGQKGVTCVSCFPAPELERRVLREAPPQSRCAHPGLTRTRGREQPAWSGSAALPSREETETVTGLAGPEVVGSGTGRRLTLREPVRPGGAPSLVSSARLRFTQFSWCGHSAWGTLAVCFSVSGPRVQGLQQRGRQWGPKLVTSSSTSLYTCAASCQAHIPPHHSVLPVCPEPPRTGAPGVRLGHTPSAGLSPSELGLRFHDCKQKHSRNYFLLFSE